jgi:hypothetical protein
MRISFKRAGVPRADRPNLHLSQCKELNASEEFEGIDEDDEQACGNWEFYLGELATFPIQEELTGGLLEHALNILGRLGWILQKPIRPLVGCFHECGLIAQVVEILCGTNENQIVLYCVRMISLYMFRFELVEPLCDLALLEKLRSLLHISDQEVANSARFCLVNLATDRRFLTLIELSEWDSIIDDLLQETEPDLPNAVWLIGLIAASSSITERSATNYLEDAAELLRRRPDFPDARHDSLVAIGTILRGLDEILFPRVAQLFQERLAPCLIQMSGFVNVHEDARLVFEIFEFLIRAGIGRDVIMEEEPVISMGMVLSGLEDEELRCSILDFLTFCTRNECDVDTRLLEPAFDIAGDGNFVERRSAIAFLCAMIENPECSDICLRLYPLIGEFLMAADLQVGVEILHYVLALFTRDDGFKAFIAENEDYYRALMDFVNNRDLAKEEDSRQVVEGLQAILAELFSEQES